jgi:hypothetical protein
MAIREILAIIFAVAGTVCWLLPGEIGGLLSHALPVGPTKAGSSVRFFLLEPPSCGSSADRQSTKGLETDPLTDPELLETFVQKGLEISIILINITDARHGEYIACC